ncbi:DsbA family protein [Klebsiella quasipneumoniae subsp. quasipneumoniae]|uniref:DsbA family protein n=1 Tax=Klebsiella quasipneumoniae TaxID=1463165 RepID=UPI001E421B3B|nr:DsbA family protein [Klebsiella quasipneumoniae]MCD7095372.1 DsbA family protein [Klebsiella quasipneumoniae subsp. similipneumoniae]
MNIKTALIAVAVSSCMLTSTLGQASEHSSVFTPEQEKRIGEITADYMRAHPDILIQMSEKLQAEQQERESRELKSAALAQQARILSDKNIPSWGPAEGTVMVVEFFDYQCIWCSRLAPELEKVMKANTNVRYYFMEWPVFGSRWPASLLAAKTGLQVWKEKGAEAYLTYHNNIYGTGLNEGRLTQEIIEKQSGKINFNQHTIEAINNTLKNINQIATTTGLTGTPGVIIMPLNGATEDNTTVFSGMTEAENIQQAINKAQGK